MIPLVQRVSRALSGWLAPAWGEELRLEPDLDAVEALAPEREALWARMERTSFLSDDEKRAAVGYEGKGAGERGGGDIGFKYREDQPRDDIGRWVEDGGSDTESGFEPSAGRGPRKPPAPPPKSPPSTPPAKAPAQPRTDFGATPNGRPFTEHGRDQATARNFTDQRIDAIVDNNARTRVGKVDSDGRKTWEYTDNRGTTVVTNENGGIVTILSSARGGVYIERSGR